MAPENEEKTGEGEEEKPAKKGKLKKLIIFGGLGLVLIAGAAAGAMMVLGGDEDTGEEGEEPTASEEIIADAHGEPSPEKKSSHGDSGQDDKGGHGEATGQGGESHDEGPPTTKYVFENPFSVNLMDKGGRRYLQCTIQIDATSFRIVETIKDEIAPLRDTIIMLLSSKTMDEVSSMEGKLKLKQEITMRAELILGTGAIKRINFTEFAIFYQ